MELKELIESAEMTERMDKAFSDLRADFELSINISEEKIEELRETNVDVDNHLQNLISYSANSSGIVSGLRGTGKTHLMLLARSIINEKFLSDPACGTFCVYLNAKRFTLPKHSNGAEVFDRAFSVFIYDELALQLKSLLEKLKEGTVFEKFLQLFDGDKHKMIVNVERAVKKLLAFKSIVRVGTDELTGISAGTITEENFESDLVTAAHTMQLSCGLSDANFKSELSNSITQEISDKVQETKDSFAYFTHNTVRVQLLSVMELLGIKSLAIYIDEWEKMYFTENLQTLVATYINHIIDNPLYFWLGVVPNRGPVAPLVIGADLQHTIDLDEALIYENSTVDRSKCLDYFTQFINKRLNYYFRDTPYAGNITENTLFNKPHNFELLVLASMGNSRDFGTMLLECWNQFQSYRKAGQYSGRPFKYISEEMIIKAIQYSGKQKRQNILDNNSYKAVWEDVETFCISKKCSHFVVEESPECSKCLSGPEFSELMYNRLIHFRKSHLTQKDSHKEKHLALYALDYASIYDLHARKKQIIFVTSPNEIHNSVRRYVYDPRSIIRKLQIEDGKVVLCKSCKAEINVKSMKAAWEKNYCPYCGDKIY